VTGFGGRDRRTGCDPALPRVPADPPTVDEVREWIDVPRVEVSDEQLADVLAGELQVQADFCDTDPYDAGLRMAMFRRCARAAAARGLPLGTLPVQMTGYPDAYGAQVIPRLDAETERYEAARRVIAIA
jgi:hypothetical protein